MSQSPISILDRVPQTLRDPDAKIDEYLPAILGPLLAQAGAGPDAAFGYILGAIDYRDRITNPDKKSKVIKGTLRKVEEIERRSGNRLLGKKIKLHFEALSDGQMKAEDISTDWIEYHGWDRDKQAFYIALSRTVHAAALENIGREVYIRKAFFTDVKGLPQGADRVRFAADLYTRGSGDEGSEQQSRSSERSESRGESRQGSGGRQGSSRQGRVSAEDLIQTAKAERLEDFSTYDRSVLNGLADLLSKHDDAEDLIDGMADILDISPARAAKHWDKREPNLVAAARALAELY